MQPSYRASASYALVRATADSGQHSLEDSCAPCGDDGARGCSQLLLRDKVMAPARSVPSMPLAGSVMEGVRSLRLDGMHSSSLHQLPVPSPTRPAPGVQGRTREPSPECPARSAPHLALAPCKFAFGSNSPRVLPSGKMDPHVNTLRSPAVPSSPSRSLSPCAFRPSGVSVCPPVIMRTGSGVPSWVAPTRRCQGTEAVS